MIFFYIWHTVQKGKHLNLSRGEGLFKIGVIFGEEGGLARFRCFQRRPVKIDCMFCIKIFPKSYLDKESTLLDGNGKLQPVYVPVDAKHTINFKRL